MNRLLCLALLALLIIAPAPAAPQPDCPVPQPQYTIRMPGMSFLAFMKAADDKVKLIAPEWHVESTPEVPVSMHAAPNLGRGRFGQAWKDETAGAYHITIGRLGLFLATVEDLASVVLHEYVHVKMWDEIEAQDWSEECKEARHELEANIVVIAFYEELGYSPFMYNNSLILYAQAQVKAMINKCPPGVRAGMPINPLKDSSLELN